MAKSYTLFVDESGDAGIEKIGTETKAGASSYFVLGAYLVDNQNRTSILAKLEETIELLEVSNLHCNKLSHRKRTFFSRSMQHLPLTCFGLISFKPTLGTYNLQIQNEATKFYHKCLGYLFELVASWAQKQSIEPNQLKFIIEESNNICVSQLRNYISICQKNPIYKQVENLNHIDPSNIFSEQKKNEPLLAIADIVANSLYQCVNKTQANFGIPEPRYLSEMKSKFAHDLATYRIIGHGIKPIHNLESLKLDKDIFEFLFNLSADDT